MVQISGYNLTESNLKFGLEVEEKIRHLNSRRRDAVASR